MFEYTVIIYKCSNVIKNKCNDIRKESKKYYFVEVDTDIPENREEYFFNIIKPKFIICENMTEEIKKYEKKYNIKIILL